MIPKSGDLIDEYTDRRSHTALPIEADNGVCSVMCLCEYVHTI
jgi:hypothetical protein